MALFDVANFELGKPNTVVLTVGKTDLPGTEHLTNDRKFMVIGASADNNSTIDQTITIFIANAAAQTFTYSQVMQNIQLYNQVAQDIQLYNQVAQYIQLYNALSTTGSVTIGTFSDKTSVVSGLLVPSINTPNKPETVIRSFTECKPTLRQGQSIIAQVDGFSGTDSKVFLTLSLMRTD